MTRILLAGILALAFWATGAAAEGHLPLPARLRGCNTSLESLDALLVERVASWGANHLRVNVDKDDRKDPLSDAPSDADPLRPYLAGLRRLDEDILPACRRTGMPLILCPSSIWGRRLDVFWSADRTADGYREHLVRWWAAIAARYRHEPLIIAYDVVNEPNYPAGRAETWYDGLLPASLAAIRASDADIPVVVEPGPWGQAKGFDVLPPLADPHLLYSFHHYAPHNYTHQGVREHRQSTRGQLAYPGLLRMFDDRPERLWNRAAFSDPANPDSLLPAVAAQDRTGRRMYVGEFGVARWAPGAERWLADSIAEFEARGWDWAFHSPSGWDGWNHTMPATAAAMHRVGAAADGGRRDAPMQAILEGLARNREPPAAPR